MAEEAKLEANAEAQEISNSASSEKSPGKSTEIVERELVELESVSEEAVDYFQSHGDFAEDDELQSKKHIPGPLPKNGLSLEEIHQRLLSLIVQGEEEEELNGVNCNRLLGTASNDVRKIALLSHTIAAYITTFDSGLLRRIAIQIVSDTTLWISRLFRFFDSSVYFHNECREGLLRLSRMVIHSRYPKYSTEGYEALYTRPPVIYYNDTTRPGLGQYLCSQLGLPLSCLSSVPCNTMLGSEYKMDVSVLEKMILEDISAAKTPLLVVASAGTSLVGHVDSLQRLQELCRTHSVWLHVEGHSLAALCLVSVPNLPSNVGDSMTLPLGMWLGIPSLPCVTIYKSKEAALVHAAGLSQTLHGQLNFFPLWVTVQALGNETVVQRTQHCFELSDRLLATIEAFPELKIIGKGRLKTKEGVTYEVSDIGKKSVSTTVLFDVLTSVVVFQYVPRICAEVDESLPATFSKNPPYFDSLNSWLGQLLLRQVPSIKTDILDLDQHGVCLRICPLESAHVLNTTLKDVDQFGVSLQQQLSILNATVKQKELLYQNHKSIRKLQLVEIANWAGMGGARYIPEFWADRLNELTDTGKEDINRLNSELVTKLKASDSAFSLGEADDGMLCVRFGMVDEGLDLEELIALVLATGQEIEESSKFLETMAEMVKQGIQEANKELIQESHEKIMQEGILRQVPVIGSFVSWWYPATNETGIKGRSFNLSSGVVESTENIYKYHMQIKEGTNHTPAASKKVLVSPSSSQVQNKSPVTDEQSKSSTADASREETASLSSKGGDEPKAEQRQ